MKNSFDIEWCDSGREPQCPPNPKFPNGIVIDGREDETDAACTIDLPYPAKRCGMYFIRCKLCDRSVAITTAGRPDDPRQLIMPCKLGGNA